MTSNVRMILDEVNARIKLAEAKTAEDPSNFDAFPGAENDKAVPAETKKPDPEVKDEGPASRTETTGAKPGSDAPVEQDHLYEADEPVLTPEKKPADSADANAKTASANQDVEKVAAEILSVIRGELSKQASVKAEKVEKKAEDATASSPAATETQTAEAQSAATETAETAEKDAGCGGGCKKGKKKGCKKTAEEILTALTDAIAKQAACGGAAAPAKKVEKKAPVKKEAAEAISLEDRILDKIAGYRMAKQAGENDAMALVKAAMEYNRGAADAKALIQKLAQALEESANSSDDAKACEGGSCDAGTPEAAGAADAEAAIADAAAAEGAVGEDPVTPEEVAQAVQELVSEGQISAEDAAALTSQIGGDAAAADGEGDVTDEQIAEGIAQAIESGAITEDEAKQLVQELVSAGADESVQNDVAAAGADANASVADAAAAGTEEAAGAADAEAAIADAQKQAEALQKQAEDEQIARYQKGFVQKCAEYGADPQKVAQYIQARTAGQR